MTDPREMFFGNAPLEGMLQEAFDYERAYLKRIDAKLNALILFTRAMLPSDIVAIDKAHPVPDENPDA